MLQQGPGVAELDAAGGAERAVQVRGHQAEITQVEGAFGKTLLAKELGEKRIKMPRRGRHVVERGAGAGPALIESGHFRHRGEIPEERLGQHGPALGDMRDLDGVVDVGDDRQALRGQEQGPAVKHAVVAGTGQGAKGNPLAGGGGR